jgi:hypothetical protein
LHKRGNQQKFRHELLEGGEYSTQKWPKKVNDNIFSLQLAGATEDPPLPMGDKGIEVPVANYLAARPSLRTGIYTFPLPLKSRGHYCETASGLLNGGGTTFKGRRAFDV